MGSYLSVFKFFIESFLISMRFKSIGPAEKSKMYGESIVYSEIEYPLTYNNFANSSFQNLMLPDLLNHSSNLNEALYSISSLTNLFSPVI